MADKEEDDEETIMETREALMVSPKGKANPSLRIAFFLKPTIKNPILDTLPSLSLTPPSETPLKVNVSFNGWNFPQEKWKSWFDQMHNDHRSLWQKTGIYEAITASTYKFHNRNTDLIIGLAEKWSPETNTFVFPWGEATVTLEDVMILGGFSVLGDPVSKPLKTDKLSKIEEELIKQRQLVIKRPAKKSSHNGWIKQTMESGSVFEHEAFLSLWLSRFVVPEKSKGHFSYSVFPIAIHLAQGTRIALAPAVLASIYRDLRLIKQAILDNPRDDETVLNLAVTAPFQLLQIWAWERLPPLQPNPKSVNPNDPLSARWNNVKPMIKSKKDIILVIDSAKESFKWRPYSIYKGNGGWVSLDSAHIDEKLVSLHRCLRASELVGMDCVEIYLPHRVSMQFGMDQDLPGHVFRKNRNKEIAWKDYRRPVYDESLYIPSLQFEPGVTTRYFDWWSDQMSLRGYNTSPSSLMSSSEDSFQNEAAMEASDNEKSDENGDEADNSFENLRGFNDNESTKGDEEEESISFKFEIPELPIEGRISNLEKVFAALKEAKFGKGK